MVFRCEFLLERLIYSLKKNFCFLLEIICLQIFTFLSLIPFEYILWDVDLILYFPDGYLVSWASFIKSPLLVICDAAFTTREIYTWIWAYFWVLFSRFTCLFICQWNAKLFGFFSRTCRFCFGNIFTAILEYWCSVMKFRISPVFISWFSYIYIEMPLTIA